MPESKVELKSVSTREGSVQFVEYSQPEIFEQGKAREKLEKLETESDGIVNAIASAETFPGVTHRRRFMYLPMKWLFAHDSLASSDAHEYSWRIHFNGMAQSKGGYCIYRSPAGPGIIVTPLGAPAELQEAKTVTWDGKGINHRAISRLVMTDNTKAKEFLALFVAFDKEAPQVSLDWKQQEKIAFVQIDGQSWKIDDL